MAGARVRRDPFGFCRIDDRPVTVVRGPRVDCTTRAVAHVPPEEIELAIVNAVRDVVLCSREEVTLTVSRLFAWRRQGSDIPAAVNAAVAKLLDRGALTETGQSMLRAPTASAPRPEG